jgi:hypothetical protein
VAIAGDECQTTGCSSFTNGTRWRRAVKTTPPTSSETVIVPALCVGMQRQTLCVNRTRARSIQIGVHAERRNDQKA